MKVNLKLLRRLYLVNHPSENEQDMISFILNYCYKIPKLTFYLDHYNNLFITKNTTNPLQYACVVAHMDTVHSFRSSREIIVSNNLIRARYSDSHTPCGLNADDCNGILVALQLLEVLPDLKVCFTVEEEIGGAGAEQACLNTDFFSDVQFLIQADRKGSQDLIIHTNGITTASDDFVDDILELIIDYGYELAMGTFTDIGVLSESLEISGVNVSCGYYNEHTTRECCKISELENCLNFIHDIIVHLSGNGKVYYVEVPKIKSTSTYPSEDLPCDHCRTFDCMNCTKYPD
jgi:di/tripeptidase